MNLTKKERQQEKELLVGYSPVQVLAFNPTKDELMKILGVDEENQDKFKEPEYVQEKTDNEGNSVTSVRIACYVKNKKGQIDSINFFLENRERVSKENPNLHQWINQLGDTAWAETEDTLFSSFKNFEKVLSWKVGEEVFERYQQGAKPNETEIVERKSFRKALVGEAELLEFLKAYASMLNRQDVNTDILLDTKKLFNGNFKELNTFIGSESVIDPIVCYCVKTKETDGEVKEIQTISNKFFLNGGALKQLRNYQLTSEKLSELREKHSKKQKLSNIEKFLVETTHSEYGIKDFFVPKELHPYNPEENFAASNTVVAEDDASY